MEVTKNNFQSLLPQITALLQKASFVSIDGEFTGLGRGPFNKYSDLDTPEERYLKDRKSVTKYGMIQIGVTIFRYCLTEKKFFTSTFCFFAAGNTSDGSYTYDASSMTFLAENNFDFNKLFLDGLPFMSLKEEQEIRNKHAEKKDEWMVPTPLKVKDDKTKNFLIEAMDRVNLSKTKGENCIFTGKSLNPFYRKLLYNNIASCFPCASFNITGGSQRNIEIVHYKTKLEKEIACGSSWEAELNEKLGLTQFIKAVLEAKKPLVGHNTVLDVLHCVDKFVVALPDTLEEFRCIMRNTLPDIFDTKLMAKDPPFSTNIINTALKPLYEELTDIYKIPDMQAEDGFKSYTIVDDGQQHDAGYDAFMTGVCFIAMAKKLEGQQWGKKCMMQAKKLDMYRNKINFMGSYDIAYLDLHQKQDIPARDYVITVQCPSDYASSDINTLLSCISNYRYNWVNENLFHVMLRDEEDQLNIVSKFNELKQKSPPNVHVMLYNDFMKKGSKANDGMDNGDIAKNKRTPKSTAAEKAAVNQNTNESSPYGLRPKTLQVNSKRSSNADGEDDEASLVMERRDLKRLKSVGSEQLSNLTLESPTNPDNLGVITNSRKKNVAEFEVPNEW